MQSVRKFLVLLLLLLTRTKEPGTRDLNLGAMNKELGTNN